MARVSHGLCANCAETEEMLEVEDFSTASVELLDALPYGVVVLDAEDRVISYNRRESAMTGYAAERVIGRHFFEEVAPCTSVRNFRGRFDEFRTEGESGICEVETFVFKLPRGNRLVSIRLFWDADTGRTTILVRQS